MVSMNIAKPTSKTSAFMSTSPTKTSKVAEQNQPSVEENAQDSEEYDGKYYNFDTADVINSNENIEPLIWYNWVADSASTSHMANR
jgi:hypothetical protein